MKREGHLSTNSKKISAKGQFRCSQYAYTLRSFWSMYFLKLKVLELWSCWKIPPTFWQLINFFLLLRVIILLINTVYKYLIYSRQSVTIAQDSVGEKIQHVSYSYEFYSLVRLASEITIKYDKFRSLWEQVGPETQIKGVRSGTAYLWKVPS